MAGRRISFACGPAMGNKIKSQNNEHKYKATMASHEISYAYGPIVGSIFRGHQRCSYVTTSHKNPHVAKRNPHISSDIAIPWRLSVILGGVEKSVPAVRRLVSVSWGHAVTGWVSVAVGPVPYVQGKRCQITQC